MKVSIIVPVYNTEKYIGKCIESIICQKTESDTQVEIILVNDGSTDESLAVCEKYAKENPNIIIVNSINGGQGHARNIGLERASGEYISFIDSDDWVLPDFIANMLQKLDQTKAEVAICGMVRNHYFFDSKIPIPSESVWNNKQLLINYMTTPYVMGSVCNKLFKRELWNNVRFPELRGREDEAVIQQLFPNIKSAVHTGTYGYVQFVRAGSTERRGHGFSRVKLQSIENVLKCKEYVEEQYPDLIDNANELVVSTYLMLMADIIESFNFRAENQLYISLYENMKRFVLENNMSIDYIKDAKPSFKFRVKNIIRGLKDEVLDAISKICMVKETI